MMSLVAEQGVSFFFTVPVLGFEYFKSPHAARCTKLRCMLYGGEPLPKELVNLTEAAVRWWGQGCGNGAGWGSADSSISSFCHSRSQSPLRLGSWNTYGPTEATVITTTALCRPADALIHIGTPDTNVHAYIVDAQLQALPIGVPGELLLSGPRLAEGYVGRPDLTAEKFIPNPCLHIVKQHVLPAMLQYYQRAYRTGDLVRWRPDGTIDYMGRIDNQIKINGVRIELGEVEAALGGALGVEQAVAKAVPDASGTKRLVGYVTPADVDPAAIVAHCRGLLVPAMVPSVVVALDAFPLLPNGKVDSKSLPSPDWSGLEEEFVQPESELEAAVAEIWAEALDTSEPISATANYFAAGGTSLKTAMVNAKVRMRLGISDLPGEGRRHRFILSWHTGFSVTPLLLAGSFLSRAATLLLDHPTIREFAAAIALHVEAGMGNGNRGRLLRSTTRAGVGTLTHKLLQLSGKSRTLHAGGINRQVAHLSAESVNVASQLHESAPGARMPLSVYLALQAVASGCVAAAVPLARALLIVALLLVWRLGGGMAAALALAPLYAAHLALLAALLVGVKGLLFSTGMRPGLYPVNGLVYLK